MNCINQSRIPVLAKKILDKEIEMALTFKNITAVESNKFELYGFDEKRYAKYTFSVEPSKPLPWASKHLSNKHIKEVAKRIANKLALVIKNAIAEKENP